MIRILLSGDTVARAGRRVLQERLREVRDRFQLDFVVSNIENAAAGYSITPKIPEELFAAGVDVMTSGNHIFDKREVLSYIEQEPRLLRPANYPPGGPGRGGWGAVVALTKARPAAAHPLGGRVFPPPRPPPSRAPAPALAALGSDVNIIL